MPDGGSIVNIASLNGVLAIEGLGAYVGSKYAVRGLSRGIRVNTVCPGSISTGITDSADFADKDWESYVRTIPAGRRGLPSRLCCFLDTLRSDLREHPESIAEVLERVTSSDVEQLAESLSEVAATATTERRTEASTVSVDEEVFDLDAPAAESPEAAAQRRLGRRERPAGAGPGLPGRTAGR
jgi:NAD(P)-dependent dehydrogenase (short-subunit alcohol dehydrogenase family)